MPFHVDIIQSSGIRSVWGEYMALSHGVQSSYISLKCLRPPSIGLWSSVDRTRTVMLKLLMELVLVAVK